MIKPTVAVDWIVEHSKIDDYLLNTSHPRGAPKARYLMRFGFSPHDPNTLARALVEHAMNNRDNFKRTVSPRTPPRIAFEGTVKAPDGREMPLRTVWEATEPPPEMRFVTAVPLTR